MKWRYKEVKDQLKWFILKHQVCSYIYSQLNCKHWLIYYITLFAGDAFFIMWLLFKKTPRSRFKSVPQRVSGDIWDWIERWIFQLLCVQSEIIKLIYNLISQITCFYQSSPVQLSETKTPETLIRRHQNKTQLQKGICLVSKYKHLNILQSTYIYLRSKMTHCTFADPLTCPRLLFKDLYLLLLL